MKIYLIYEDKSEMDCQLLKQNSDQFIIEIVNVNGKPFGCDPLKSNED